MKPHGLIPLYLRGSFKKLPWPKHLSLLLGVAGLVILGGCSDSVNSTDEQSVDPDDSAYTEDWPDPRFWSRQDTSSKNGADRLNRYSPYTDAPNTLSPVVAQNTPPEMPTSQLIANAEGNPTALRHLGLSGPNVQEWTGYGNVSLVRGGIEIPAYTLVTPDGNYYTGRYTLRCQTLGAMKSIANSPVGTQSVNGELLQSQGMFFIEATANDGTALKIKNNRRAYVNFPMLEAADLQGYQVYYGRNGEDQRVLWEADADSITLPTRLPKVRLPKIYNLKRVLKAAELAKLALYRAHFELKDYNNEAISRETAKHAYVDWDGSAVALFGNLPLEFVTDKGELEPAMQFAENRKGYFWVDTLLYELVVYDQHVFRNHLKLLATASQIRNYKPQLWSSVVALRPAITTRQAKCRQQFDAWVRTQSAEKQQFFARNAGYLNMMCFMQAKALTVNQRFPVRRMGWLNLDRPVLKRKNEPLMVQATLPDGSRPQYLRYRMANAELRINVVRVLRADQLKHPQIYIRDPYTRLELMAVADGQIHTRVVMPDELKNGQLNTFKLEAQPMHDEDEPPKASPLFAQRDCPMITPRLLAVDNLPRSFKDGNALTRNR